MEIIHTYKSEDAEICVISDGSSVHLADKNDLAVESPRVGTVLKPSEMTEVYIEIPIPVLQEVSRRSEIFVEPDEEEEEASGDDEEGQEEEEEDDDDEEEALLPWEPIARERFFTEYKELDEGTDLRVLVNFPIKARWEAGDVAMWSTTDGSYDLTEVLEANEGLQACVASIGQRIEILLHDIQVFTDEQIDLGHNIGTTTVDTFLDNELAQSKRSQVADAAE